MRKSVAHEGVGAWSAKEGEGVNILVELVDSAGRDERSAARSNGDCAIGGAGDKLWLAEKKRAASSPKPEGTVCVVRNVCSGRTRS